MLGVGVDIMTLATQPIPAAGGGVDNLLLEDGNDLLLEDGSQLLLG